MLCACCSLLSVNVAYAAFTATSQGSRPAAMGSAFTAVADGADTVLYNPAGLAHIANPEAIFTYAKPYSGLEGVNLGSHFTAFAVPLKGNGAIALGWVNFFSQDQYQEDMLCLSYGRNMNERISLGGALKYLGHRYTLDERTAGDSVFGGGNSKYAVAVDVGALMRLPISDEKTINLAFSAKNLNQPDIGLKTEDKVPFELTIGGAYSFKETIVPSLDITYRAQEWGGASDKIRIRLGAETWLHKRLIALRGGVNSSEIALGFGLNPRLWNWDIQFDYAFLYPLLVKETTGTHHLSLSLKFLK